jgi:hypothetical protein
MNYSVGFTCDANVYSSISKIPRGFRSMMIRNAILEYDNKISDFLLEMDNLENERLRFIQLKQSNSISIKEELNRIRAKETELDVILWSKKYSDSKIEVI